MAVMFKYILLFLIICECAIFHQEFIPFGTEDLLILFAVVLKFFLLVRLFYAK